MCFSLIVFFFALKTVVGFVGQIREIQGVQCGAQLDIDSQGAPGDPRFEDS